MENIKKAARRLHPPLCLIIKTIYLKLEELIQIIDEIVKHGLDANVRVVNKRVDLEENLVKLYSKYFEIQYELDESNYQEFDKANFPEVIENVRSNFTDFGWYRVVLNSEQVLSEPELGTGDAIDDLSDIIYDLLEIKWRKETNSEQNGWWFFEHIFPRHTRPHVLGLLN